MVFTLVEQKNHFLSFIDEKSLFLLLFDYKIPAQNSSQTWVKNKQDKGSASTAISFSVHNGGQCPPLRPFKASRSTFSQCVTWTGIHILVRLWTERVCNQGIVCASVGLKKVFFVFPQVKMMYPQIHFPFQPSKRRSRLFEKRNSPDPHSLNLLRAHLYVGGAHIQARSPRGLMQPAL